MSARKNVPAARDGIEPIGSNFSARETRSQYESGYRLGLLHARIVELIDQAENLLGTFDEMERIVTNAQWAARNVPKRKKGKR